jgi:uncharacterized heparinase superfamily protein
MQLTLAEQTSLARLAVDRARRTTLARVLRSPLMRWRYGAPVADEVLIVPPDLRAADPSFAREIEQGELGLAGHVAAIGDCSPFDLVPPSVEWVRELHGFSWLRHLAAAGHGDEAAQRIATGLVAAWIARGHATDAAAWEPQVIGRRIISWLSHAGLLLEDVDHATYDRTTNSLARQHVRLSATWRDAPPGAPRLVALMALLFGGLSLAGREAHLKEAEAEIAAELEAQILSDGGHVSRNPAVLVELLLDLLPLRQCFLVRERQPPAAIEDAIGRMISMLRFMRLGDGSLARFNGMGATPGDALATVIAYGPESQGISEALHSRYVRMEHGELVLIADAGPPPPLEHAGAAHAGCLSFELSAGGRAVFINGGAAGPADQDWRAASRATASHNTVCVGATSSSRLVRHPLIERLIGAAPIRFPESVEGSIDITPHGDVLDAHHDGYVAAFGLVHRRRLMLAASGSVLEGHDSLGPPHGTLRLKQDVPFAVHFHLHPDVKCERVGAAQRVELVLPGGERWRFSVEGAELTLGESVHYADLAGPRHSLQIVLRGSCCGETFVLWRLEKSAQ